MWYSAVVSHLNKNLSGYSNLHFFAEREYSSLSNLKCRLKVDFYPN